MKCGLQLLSSIAIVMLIGCNRESRSARESDAAAHNSKTTVARRYYSLTDEQKAARAEWERALKKQERQYERMEELAKEVSTACAGTNGEEAVDTLLAKVSDVLDAFESSADQGYAITQRTGLVSPIIREIESHWAKRWFELAKTPPEDVLHEIQHFCRLSTKFVDLLRKKVGNSFDTTSLELNICTSLKWVTHHFERGGWKEQKKEVERMLEEWKENRYDVLEGNPLKDACEHVEFYASKDPNREKRHVAVYSRTKNMYVDKALHIVGRLPKWFTAWAEEMERQDNFKSK